MKLLLTSGGITNTSIATALQNLVEKPFKEVNVAFIPTAANVESGDKDWLILNYKELYDLGIHELDIVDFSAVTRDVWLPRLQHADILVFGGGNTFHLMYCAEKYGLKEELLKLLQTRVYVGISAGSMITTKNLALSQSRTLYSEEIGQLQQDDEGLGFVDFHIRPHLHSPWFPKVRSEVVKPLADQLQEPVYAIDDNTAIQVINGEITLVSEGKWQLFD